MHAAILCPYNQRMNPRVVIWFGIAMSTVIYLVVAMTLGGETGDFEQAARSSYVPVLYGLALFSFIVGWLVVPRVVKSSAHTRMIAALAVFEACAIFGLIAAFLTKDWRLYLGPWALALFGFIREFPRDAATTGPGPV
jgi:hypothetical protein